MTQLTHERAVRVLSESRDLADLAEAAAFLADDPASKPEELLAGLDHPGVVADQAAIALHRMTETPLSPERQPVTSKEFWQRRLLEGPPGSRLTDTARRGARERGT